MIIDKPNYTQIPNCIIDNMKELSDAEFKVLMVIARKTFGWQKQRDRISLTQIMEISGMSKQGVINGKKGLITKGIISEYFTHKGNEYEVNVVNQNKEPVNEVDQASQRSRPEPVNEVDQASQRSRHTKERETKVNKLSKETEIDDFISTIYTPKLSSLLKDFKEMRKELKKPVTLLGVRHTVNKLREWYPTNNSKQIECVEMSIMNNWQGIFKLNENNIFANKNNKQPYDEEARTKELEARYGNK